MYKELLEIVGSGKPTGSVLKETIVVSLSVAEKRAKSTQPNPSPSSPTQQNERKASRTQNPRGRSLSGRMFRWSCKVTSKELAPTHSVKSGILQNTCSTRPRVVVGLEKRAHTHTPSG